MKMKTRPLPLDGILVVDLSRAVAGPFCTMNLGDFGARIIKIEEPGLGDETRHWGPPFVQSESTYWLGINRNKESVALDLKTGEGRAALLRIIAKADVVIENFRPGVTKRLGIDYASLCESQSREDLIYVSISGFGQTGPDRHKAGYDMMIQAMSGLMAVSAYPDGPPVKCGFPVADVITSLYAGQAIAALLFARTRDGKGRFVELALLDGMLAAMCSVTSSWLLAHKEPKPMGAMQANIAPYQIFHCADGMMVVGALNQRLWEGLCAALERPEWLLDPRFRDNGLRVTNREQLAPLVESVLVRETRAHWMEVLERAGVPCGPVWSIGEVLEAPIVRDRGSIIAPEHPQLGRLEMYANPTRIEGTGLRRDPPPLLGEHTERVLSEFAPVSEPRS